MNNCDIVIYDFNLMSNLKKCIDSVINNTNLNINCLYAIGNMNNDKSVKPWLLQMQKKLCNLHFENTRSNNKNINVKILNKILKNSNNDVILLSGDTIVSKNWLNKIADCANLRSDIGLVAPLSNDFVFQTIPSISNITEDKILQICNNTLEAIYDGNNNNYYLEIPLVCSSCIFIKRSILNKVGYFIEDKFDDIFDVKKEFSLRCQDYGFSHIASLNTYVFNIADKLNIKNNFDIDVVNTKLNNLYKPYNYFINLWMTNKNIKYIKNNLAFALLNFNNRHNVFYLIHDYDTTLGGTTLHVNDLVKYMIDSFNFVIFSWSTKHNCYVASIITKEYKTKVLFNSVAFIDPFKIYSTGFKDLCNSIFDLVNFSILHVHHFLYSYVDIVDVAKSHGCETFFTIHDYYSICPTITLLDNNLKCCIDIKNKNCSVCLQKKYGFGRNSIELWQKRWNKVLLKFDHLIAPSDTCKYWMNRYFNELNITVVNHGLDLKRYNLNNSILDNHINVGIVGCLRPSKGANLLKDLVKSCGSKKVKFYSFGWTDDKFLSSTHKNYIPIGAYKREDLQSLLIKSDINIVCLLSIWPETYGYTLDEVAAAGIPVLCFDIGAIAERVKIHQIGWTISCKSSNEEIIEKILDILNDKKNYEKICKNVQKYKIRTAKDMSNEYLLMYKNKNVTGSKIDYCKALNTIEKNYIVQ